MKFSESRHCMIESSLLGMKIIMRVANHPVIPPTYSIKFKQLKLLYRLCPHNTVPMS